MAPVRGPNSCYVPSMARRGQPVANRGADPPATADVAVLALPPGNEEHNAVPRSPRSLEQAVDRRPRRLQVQPVKIEGGIGLDRTAAQTSLPSTVETVTEIPGSARSNVHFALQRCLRCVPWSRWALVECARVAVARVERANGCRHPPPQCNFVRAELARQDRCPWEAKALRCPTPTCPRQKPRPPHLRPRKCRSGLDL